MGTKSRTGKGISRTRRTANPVAGKKAPRRRAAAGNSTQAAVAKAKRTQADSSDNAVERYLSTLDGWRAEVASALRHLVREAAPEAQEAIKWGQPVYSQNGPLCYFKAFKNHVNLGFWRGKDLPDSEGVLAGGGKKMAHVKLTGPGDLRPELFSAFVRQAVQLNQTRGDPTRP